MKILAYLKDTKSWTISTFESVVILLFNWLFLFDLLILMGGCTPVNVTILAVILFFARFLLFFVCLVWRGAWK